MSQGAAVSVAPQLMVPVPVVQSVACPETSCVDPCITGPRFSVPGLRQLKLAGVAVPVFVAVGEAVDVAVPVEEGAGVTVAVDVPVCGDGVVPGVVVPFCKMLNSSEALRWLNDSVA